MSGISPAVQWLPATPLWSAPGVAPGSDKPAILRFSSDTFMADLAGRLAAAPVDLGDLVATPRSYRPAPPGADASWQPALSVLKLYQPIHGDFNIVAASLVCRVPGLPDRTLDTAEQETVGFVLRKLSGPGNTSEMAWNATAKEWRAVPVGAEKRVLAGEQVSALSPVTYSANGKRRLFVGLIPTSNGEALKSAATNGKIATAPAEGDPRMDDFETRVLGPLESMGEPMTPPNLSGKDLQLAQRTAAAARTEASRFVLVDFAELLQKDLPGVWTAIAGESRPAAGEFADLYDVLGARASSSSSVSARQRLREAWAERLNIVGEATPASTLDVDLSTGSLRAGDLRPKIRGALNAGPYHLSQNSGSLFVESNQTVAGKEAYEMPVSGIDERTSGIGTARAPAEQLFVVRCVLRRPQCNPPVDVVSEPTRAFAIASFFDVDAPARKFRVELPIRTAIADLRKYPKNVGFPLSDQLREQMCRATDMKKVLAGQLAGCESIDIGMLCSFSIPVITICALIVLMIFINLLNIVFWWLPFLKVCLPIPLRGKPE